MGLMVPSYLRGANVLQDIGPRYWSARQGQRFAVTHQTPGTGITGQTSFVATTPTLLLYRAAAASRLILSGLTLGQVGTVAGGVIYAAVAIDSANRYSAGGTAIVAQNMFAGHAGAAETIARYNPTASAAGAGTRYVFACGIDAVVGRLTSIDFGDGLLVPETGSVLVYTWAAVTGPTWALTAEFVEEAV